MVYSYRVSIGAARGQTLRGGKWFDWVRIVLQRHAFPRLAAGSPLLQARSSNTETQRAMTCVEADDDSSRLVSLYSCTKAVSTTFSREHSRATLHPCGTRLGSSRRAD